VLPEREGRRKSPDCRSLGKKGKNRKKGGGEGSKKKESAHAAEGKGPFGCYRKRRKKKEGSKRKICGVPRKKGERGVEPYKDGGREKKRRERNLARGEEKGGKKHHSLEGGKRGTEDEGRGK